MSHLKVAFTQRFSIDPISCQPLPGSGHIPVSSLRRDLSLKHNSRVPRNSDPQNSGSSPLSWQPKWHSCPSHTQPLETPNTSVVSRSPYARDLSLVPPRSLHFPCASPILEEFAPAPSGVVHTKLSSAISESIPGDTVSNHLTR